MNFINSQLSNWITLELIGTIKRSDLTLPTSTNSSPLSDLNTRKFITRRFDIARVSFVGSQKSRSSTLTISLHKLAILRRFFQSNCIAIKVKIRLGIIYYLPSLLNIRISGSNVRTNKFPNKISISCSIDTWALASSIIVVYRLFTNSIAQSRQIA